MKTIKLTQNKYTLIDEQNFEFLSKFKWCYNNGYAMRGIRNGEKTNKVYMHTQILGIKKGMEIDHKNGDGLDNRRHNLRICTREENARNMTIPNHNTSGSKGVNWRKDRNKWRAFLTFKNKFIHLGYFEIKEKAIEAYNIAAKKYFKKFARLNVI